MHSGQPGERLQHPVVGPVAVELRRVVHLDRHVEQEEHAVDHCEFLDDDVVDPDAGREDVGRDDVESADGSPHGAALHTRVNTAWVGRIEIAGVHLAQLTSLPHRYTEDASVDAARENHRQYHARDDDDVEAVVEEALVVHVAACVGGGAVVVDDPERRRDEHCGDRPEQQKRAPDATRVEVVLVLRPARDDDHPLDGDDDERDDDADGDQWEEREEGEAAGRVCEQRRQAMQLGARLERARVYEVESDEDADEARPRVLAHVGTAQVGGEQKDVHPDDHCQQGRLDHVRRHVLWKVLRRQCAEVHHSHIYHGLLIVGRQQQDCVSSTTEQRPRRCHVGCTNRQGGLRRLPVARTASHKATTYIVTSYVRWCKHPTNQHIKS